MSNNHAPDAVRAMLANNAGVAALVGGRIYPDEAPAEADLPLIVYAVRLQEAVDGTAPICQASIDVHCYAESDDDATTLMNAAAAAMETAGGRAQSTQVMWPTLEDWEPVRSAEDALWGRLLRFGATVVRG